MKGLSNNDVVSNVPLTVNGGSFNGPVSLTCIAGPNGKLALQSLVSWNQNDPGVCDPTNSATYSIDKSKCSAGVSEVDIDVVGRLTIQKSAPNGGLNNFGFTYTNDSVPVYANLPGPLNPFSLQDGGSAVIWAEIGKKIELEDYLKAIGPRPQVSGSSRHQIGVIVARGIILDGDQPSGRIGGDSLGDLIRDARLNPDVRALVLRLDTNGGSSFASEVVRRELELTRLAGRPVVVSMGSAAASGGYWIATAASEIWASPTTITGSIGIFGAFATFEESLAKLGVHNDGVGTNQMADAFIPTRALNPQLSAAMQQITERGYRVFLEKVANGRGMSLEAVEQIAQGRVWTGSRAQKLGLVDKLGNLEAAVESAAALAGLSDYSVIALDKPLTTREKLIRSLNRLIESRVPSKPSSSSSDGLKLLREMWTDFSPLQQLNDPIGHLCVLSALSG